MNVSATKKAEVIIVRIVCRVWRSCKSSTTYWQEQLSFATSSWFQLWSIHLNNLRSHV